MKWWLNFFFAWLHWLEYIWFHFSDLQELENFFKRALSKANDKQHITSLPRYTETEEGVHVFEEIATRVMVRGDPLELQVDRLKGFLSSDMGFSLWFSQF